MMRSRSNLLGATLLEVMLVLSIVSLIILMSVRYYQATSTASKTQQVMSAIQAITAAADNVSLGSAGGYSAATSSNIVAIAGSSALVSPGGGNITVTPGSSTTYNVTIPAIQANVCSIIKVKLKDNLKYNITCSGNNLAYSYDSTK